MIGNPRIRHFYRLIRGNNLLIVAMTMMVVKYYVFDRYALLELSRAGVDQPEVYLPELFRPGFQLDFLLLIISTVLITAAGNVINDYFDIRADRVNRPESIVIGKHIKRRVAIVMPWGFNTVGALISLYLGWKYQSVWLAVIPCSATVILWTYSTYFKRKLLVGNLLIALLTALVVILPAHFLIAAMNDFARAEETYVVWGATFVERAGLDWEPAYFITGLLAIFAAFTNFIREIVKDLHDIDGDRKIHCETIPIVAGERFTRILIGGLLSLMLLFFGLFFAMSFSKLDGANVSILTSIIGVLLLLAVSAAFVLNIIAKTKKQHYLVSHLLKVIMLLGLSLPIAL